MVTSHNKRKRSSDATTKASSKSSDYNTTLDDDRITIKNIVVRLEKIKLKNLKEVDRTESNYRVHYDIILSSKCCHKKEWIIASSTKEVWNAPPDDRPMIMRNLMDAAIQRHTTTAKAKSLDCSLDCESAMSLISGIDQFWRFLWSQGMDKIRDDMESNQKRSAASRKAKASRAENILAKDWEVGSKFKSRQNKSNARKNVMQALELASDKSTTKLYEILSYVITKVSKKINKAGIDFDQNSILPLKQQRRLVVMESMMTTANTCIKGMKNRISKEKLGILTAVAAIFLPDKAERMHQAACDILGLNRKASYTKLGVENRLAYNNFLKLKGKDINIGEMVICRDGYGRLISKDETSITISLEPWQYEKKYDERLSTKDVQRLSATERARMARWEPTLNAYDREQRKDITPPEWIESIHQFHMKHNHPSPNTKDIITRRHPDHPTVKQEAVKIYRYETYNQLWEEFQKEYPGIADKIRNSKNPKECPSMIRTSAPWQLVKGKDSSCLCINCEGTNAVRRGSRAAIKAIEPLKTNINTKDDSEAWMDDIDEASDTDSSDSDTEEEEKCSYPTCTQESTLGKAQQCVKGCNQYAHRMCIPQQYQHLGLVCYDCTEAEDGSDENEVVRVDDSDIEDTEEEVPLTSESDKEKEKKIAAKILRLFDILDAQTKYDACIACLTCLEVDENGNRKLEDAKFSCINGECPTCGFDKVWSKGIRNHILMKEWDDHTKEFVEKLNPKSSFATDVWMTKIDWRAYEYKEGPSIAAHAKNVARQAAAARVPDADDGDYSPGNESKSARNLCLVTHRGTLIDYLDFIEKQMTKHVLHRNLVCTEHRSKKDYERNSRPWSVESDIDFSENGPIENFDKAQSEHWKTEQYTLFMTIFSFLMVDEWNKKEGDLEVGQAVTVDGELYLRDEEDVHKRPDINHDSYWAVVSARKEEDIYTVTDVNGNAIDIPRSRLRLRKRHTICCASVSDDKKHDRFAMQHFTTKELEWLEEYMNENFKNDIPTGKVTHLHQHSDNAGQHFKSVGSIEYFTSLVRTRGGPTKCKYVYSFGAPGHGKGFFDGLGGVFKNKIHSLIKGTKNPNRKIAGTVTGYINDVTDVYNALKEYFEADGLDSDKEYRRRKGKNQVDKFKFFKYVAGADEQVRRTDETFTKLDKINSRYQFCVSNVGIVHSRMRSCWCLKCYDALTSAGSIGWREDHRITGCTSSPINQATDVYQFIKRSCKKLTGTDAALETRNRAQSRNEMAKTLTTAGMWVLFRSDDDTDQPFWLGRTMSRAEWGNKCIWHNNTNRQEDIIDEEGRAPPAAIEGNKYAINVQWYTQKVIGTLEYIVEGGENTKPFVMSNDSLLLVGFDDDMHQVLGTRVRAPRRRTVRSNQNDDFEYTSTRQSLQTTEGDWYRREYGNLWRMKDGIRDLAMEKLGNWHT